MNITGLDALVFGVDDLAACRRYLVVFQRKLTRWFDPICWSPFTLHLSVGVTSVPPVTM